MDRSDEVDTPRVVNTSHDEEDSVVRNGDILGLSGAAVPKAPGDPVASNDPESVAHRRKRALSEEPQRVQEDIPKGATGIDMGYGGNGTDVSGD